MDTYWLEQKQTDVPAENDWLSASEQAHLARILVAKRRGDWRLGRWTGKRALAAYLQLPAARQGLANVEIRPALSGAPDVFLANAPASATISLSHCNGAALCAVAPAGVALGCDLEAIEARSEAFIADYFTADEQAVLRQAGVEHRSRFATLLWSAKESAAKALRAGLRLDTRWLAASLDDARRFDGDDTSWRPLHVRYIKGQVFHGWWQQNGNFLRTLVASPRPWPPILLAESGEPLGQQAHSQCAQMIVT